MKLIFQILLFSMSSFCLAQNDLNFPIKIENSRFDWSTIDYQRDKSILKNFVLNHKSEFEYYLLKDDYTPTVNDLYEDLYLLDLNGDNELDIVFDGESGGEPYSIKVFINSNNISLMS